MSGDRLSRGATLAAAAGAATFAMLAVGAGLRATPGPIDAAAHAVLLEAVGGARRVPLVLWVTWLGNNLTLWVAVIGLAVAFVAARRPAWALRLVVASGGGGLVVRSLKELFARARPDVAVVEAAGYSFPSGHAFAGMVFYGMLVVLVWRATRRADARTAAAMLAGLVVLGVGLSRVVLGVHYLSDVVAGWGAGLAWLVGSQVLASVLLRRFAPTWRDGPDPAPPSPAPARRA